MQIKDLRLERREEWARASATVLWEDSYRPAREIFFEAAGPLAADLACNPHAFLVAGLVPAMHHGEQRIAIDAPICPDLRNGLLANMQWLNTWYGARYRPIAIETASGLPPFNAQLQRHAGVFFSGGVDSMATLRANQLDYPCGHPAAFKSVSWYMASTLVVWKASETRSRHFMSCKQQSTPSHVTLKSL